MKWEDLYQHKFITELSVKTKELNFFRSRLRLETILKVIEVERNSITTKLGAIKAFDPSNSLKRGFSLVYSINGDLIKSVHGVKKRDNLKIAVTDGRIISTVKNIEGD